MSLKAKTHMNRAFDHLDHVVYIMVQVRKGINAQQLKTHLVEEEPFPGASREYRSKIAHWLIGDFVKPFTPGALSVFARIMVSESVDTKVKRELLFWKTCERDMLAREITLGPVYRAYHRKEPFLFFDDLVHTAVEKTGFVKGTAQKCVRNYLSIAKKIGFLDPRENRLDLNFYRPRQKSVLAILYFLFHAGVSPASILQAQDFRFLLMDERDLVSTLSELSSAGWIEFAMAGNVVRLEPRKAFKELPDALEK